METLLSQLVSLTGQLVVLVGAGADSLADARRWIAAGLIRDNPALLPVVIDTSVDPEIIAAALAGEQLAAELAAAGRAIRVERRVYIGDLPIERTAESFGPFLDKDLEFVMFDVVDITSFRRVRSGSYLFGVPPVEMLVPPGSVADEADPAILNLPAGSVWLRANRFVAGTAGWVALRIASGTLHGRFVRSFRGDPVLLSSVPWVLRVVPEQPPPAQPEGSDGDAVAVTLPTELRVRSDGPAECDGPLAMSGFGSDVRVDRPAGVVLSERGIAMLFDPAAMTWSIGEHRSTQFRLAGATPAPVEHVAWVLPIGNPALHRAGEAAHGGTFIMVTEGTIDLRLPDASGRGRPSNAEVYADAGGVELRSWKAEPFSLSTDVGLWATSSTTLTFGDTEATVRLVSRRGGADIAEITRGGSATNRWNLPRAARGEPFAFDGDVESMASLTERDGLRRMRVVASRPVAGGDVEGYVLENLYLHVSPMQRVTMVGSGATTAALSDGRARLVFDVVFAQPMLPDPYAANWNAHLPEEWARSGLEVDVAWDAAGAKPHPRLIAAPTFPSPPKVDDDPGLDATRHFQGLLGADPARLHLLDVSGGEHRFGVALEPLLDRVLPTLEGDRLCWPLKRTRLLMEPQVHWEPVHVIANAKAGVDEEVVLSRSHGGPTLVGTTEEDTVVPALPAEVGAAIVEAAHGRAPAGALFGLPFGLHAYVKFDDDRHWTYGAAETLASLDTPRTFIDSGGVVFSAAQQLRLVATGVGAGGAADPARSMPGVLVQTANLRGGSLNGLNSVLSDDVADAVNQSFAQRVPLHHADLSGHGLSTFSRWTRLLDDPGPGIEGTGVTEVRFEVLVGRTSFEVIQLQTRLFCPQCRVVRTVVLERRNSGRVHRYDSGWVPIEDGECQRYARIETGVVTAFRNIRNIRIVPRPVIAVDNTWSWQEVLYDADLEIDADPRVGRQRIPITNHTGYVQVAPVDTITVSGQPNDPSVVPTADQFDALIGVVGAFGGPVDAAVDLGGTLRMQFSHLEVNSAPGGPGKRFAISVSGTPVLPADADWTTARIDTGTGNVTAVDRRGLPVVRRPGEVSFSFRDASDTCRNDPQVTYGLLMSTATARILFPDPTVEPGASRIASAAPLLADPTALVHATGLFPPTPYVLRALEPTSFTVADGGWQLPKESLRFDPPVPHLVNGGGWSIDRSFEAAQPLVKLAFDTINAGTPWSITSDDKGELNLSVGPFKKLLTIRSNFEANDVAAGFTKPTMELGADLADVQDIINVLEKFVELDFKLDVHVSAGSGPIPSFVIRFGLSLRLPEQPGERIDIGIGKFHGHFQITGELHADVTGTTRGRLDMELSGDVQQGIIPPLLYAGGFFRFSIGFADGTSPRVELALATTASVGGALIPNLIELEATVRYGYTLVPETLKPGVLLGLEVRAKLLAGLLGLSFSADAMARIERLDPGKKTVTIWAEIRAAATIQVAWAFEDEREIRTQFQQELPLEPFAVAAGLNPLLVLAAHEL